ncbi:unnamed protein product [Heligmosomoides polygyrus]|uniref:Uncharacterized protein n=1 Tax=Heligmosomoides polygyrus TaxID=6339 RepID=A0A183FMG4_HELPZ|nr:unnamed protein product [Heligmosomoides polygyrus]
MASIDVWDRVVVDIKMVNDQGRAQEVLRNLWSYRRLETLHLQGCALTDGDIAGVEHVNRRVKYLCLRGNDLCSPWQAFSTKFPELLVLDCMGNRCLDLPRRKVRPDNEAEEVPVTLCEVIVDVRSLVARNGGISRVEGSARELCPKISRLNYSDVNIEDEGIGEGGKKKEQKTTEQENLKEDDEETRFVIALRFVTLIALRFVTLIALRFVTRCGALQLVSSHYGALQLVSSHYAAVRLVSLRCSSSSRCASSISSHCTAVILFHCVAVFLARPTAFGSSYCVTFRLGLLRCCSSRLTELRSSHRPTALWSSVHLTELRIASLRFGRQP